MRMVLHATTDSDHSKQVLLRRGELSVGRSYLADVPCPHDACMSDVHLRIFKEDSRYLLSDLDSTNGSYINGFAITGTTALSHGDTIRAGNTQFQVQIEDDQPRPSDPSRITGLPVAVPVASATLPRRCGGTYTARPCETGLVVYHGSSKTMPPHMLAAMLASRDGGYFVIDYARAMLTPPGDDRCEWLLNWLPAECRAKMSPRIVSASQMDQTKMFQLGWGRDAIALVCPKQHTDSDQLFRQLRELAGMFVRPSVLVPQLCSTAANVVEALFEDVAAILVEDVNGGEPANDGPADWLIFAQHDFAQSLQRFGLTNESEKPCTPPRE